MLNILFLLAGAGQRFKDAGYTLPKPLIQINQQPMISYVIDNVITNANHIFLVQDDHCKRHNIDIILNQLSPGCQIVRSNALTAGAAATALLATDLINNHHHLLIVNSDQYLTNFNCRDFLNHALGFDGCILTFQTNDQSKKWSYVSLNDRSQVIEVKEKQPISNIATVGYYYFSHGYDFVEAAQQMIAADDRTNNEFYLAPTYNYLIKQGKTIITYNIDQPDFNSMGNPDDLSSFGYKFNYQIEK